MRAACAHYRRSYGNVLCEGIELGLCAEYLLGNDSLRDLADVAEKLLADTVNADIFAVALDNAVKFLDNVDLIALCGKVPDKLCRHRVYHTQLEETCLVAERLLCVFVADACGDNAYFCIAHLDPVKVACFSKLGSSL